MMTKALFKAYAYIIYIYIYIYIYIQYMYTTALYACINVYKNKHP